MPYTQVANLDFNQIKASLKEYMRAQSDFTDYDFEGSGMNILLDTLAYNTHYLVSMQICLQMKCFLIVHL